MSSQLEEAEAMQDLMDVNVLKNANWQHIVE